MRKITMTAYQVVKVFFYRFCRLGTIPVCEGQTDEKTSFDSMFRTISKASRGKNACIVGLVVFSAVYSFYVKYGFLMRDYQSQYSDQATFRRLPLLRAAMNMNMTLRCWRILLTEISNN